MCDKPKVDSTVMDISVPDRGFIHTYASNAPSSIKTQLVKAMANNRLQDSRSFNLSRLHRRKRSRKDNKLNSLDNIIVSSGYTLDDLDNHLYFFKMWMT